jgi:hypothetical protein
MKELSKRLEEFIRNRYEKSRYLVRVKVDGLPLWDEFLEFLKAEKRLG